MTQSVLFFRRCGLLLLLPWVAAAELRISEICPKPGELDPNGLESGWVEFVNDGDTPLVIISANATCGCTRPKYPTDPVKPGGKGVIKVTYLPKGRPGEFEKTVKVRTNSKKNKKVVLKISGVVVP